ncbi:MAG: hypothetical protein IJ496_08805 [Ruminococcus sp.]|nr:hypothetical protein [Ruminococcus sp.]
MASVKAEIVYETGKNQTASLSIVMERYHVEEHGALGENGQHILNIQQKSRNEMHVSFYILTYQGANLKGDGTFSEEKIEDVREKVEAVRNLRQELAELHRQPICRMQWGEERFSGILTSLQYRYTMYAENGIPVRANFEAVFQEAVDIDSALQNDNTPQSPDRSKYRPVYENTHLYQMAYQEYNDAGAWRVIAEANGLSDPLDVRPGMMLVLPPL